MNKTYHVPWVQHDEGDNDLPYSPSIIQVEAPSPAQALKRAKSGILKELLQDYCRYLNDHEEGNPHHPRNTKLPREEKPGFFYGGDLKFKNNEDDFSLIYLGEPVELSKL